MNKKLHLFGTLALASVLLMACGNKEETVKVDGKEISVEDAKKPVLEKSDYLEFQPIEVVKLNQEKSVTLNDFEDDDLNGLVYTPIQYQTFKEITVFNKIENKEYKAKDGNVFVLIEYYVENSAKTQKNALMFAAGEKVLTFESGYEFKVEGLSIDTYNISSAYLEHIGLSDAPTQLNPLEKIKDVEVFEVNEELLSKESFVVNHLDNAGKDNEKVRLLLDIEKAK